MADKFFTCFFHLYLILFFVLLSFLQYFLIFIGEKRLSNKLYLLRKDRIKSYL